MRWFWRGAAVTCVSAETLAGTLCRWSSLQSTVLAWWYTDWGVYQGLVSHTHCRGHGTAPPAGHNTHRAHIYLHDTLVRNLYGIFIYSFSPWVALADDVTRAKRRVRNTAYTVTVHCGGAEGTRRWKCGDIFVQKVRGRRVASTAGWKHTGSDDINL